MNISVSMGPTSTTGMLTWSEVHAPYGVCSGLHRQMVKVAFSVWQRQFCCILREHGPQ